LREWRIKYNKIDLGREREIGREGGRERDLLACLLVIIDSPSSAHKRFIADNIIGNEYSHTALAWTEAVTIQIPAISLRYTANSYLFFLFLSFGLVWLFDLIVLTIEQLEVNFVSKTTLLYCTWYTFLLKETSMMILITE
jgi:hypothetical protein